MSSASFSIPALIGSDRLGAFQWRVMFASGIAIALGLSVAGQNWALVRRSGRTLKSGVVSP